MAASLLPHSFVLADVFQVESMELDVPEHLYEAEPELDRVTCPNCDGEGWVFGGLNTWTGGDTFKPCLRCYREGVVLDVVTADEEEHRHYLKAA